MSNIGIAGSGNSTADPAYFGACAADNYLSLAADANLDLDRIVELAENSFRASWLTPGRLDGFLREIDDYGAAHRPSGSEIA
ncbi:hypothetical protein ACQPXH_27425 [Nocardia sp. CA-135953]|uniref:hypothetical protein n=1 Tax=Nocardia sp. CA-135953 TaxID=3239978 RepID=UPI003D97C0B4